MYMCQGPAQYRALPILGACILSMNPFLCVMCLLRAVAEASAASCSCVKFVFDEEWISSDCFASPPCTAEKVSSQPVSGSQMSCVD